MSYATKLLSRGEEIVFETRQHWFGVIARTWLWILLLILGAAVLMWVLTDGSGLGEPSSTILLVGSIALVAVAAIRVLLVIWAWQNQEFLVTTRRVIRAEGIFNKQMSDSSLEKVNDARLRQSIFGRIFDYGTLDILTAADEEGAIDDFPMIADPVKFKIAMLNQKELLERPDLAPPPRQQPIPQPAMQRVPPEPPRAGSPWIRPVEEGASPASESAAASPVEAVPSDPSTQAAPPAAAGRGDGAINELAETLERLGELRDRGLITTEEFETKKRQLLERF